MGDPMVQIEPPHTKRLERLMPKYPLSEKLQRVRDNLTPEELNLLCQERVDRAAAAIYQQGIMDGREKLLKEQRDERERRKIGRAKKEWATVIYFIQSPTAVKIGMAKDANRRLMVLQTSHPDELELLATCKGGRVLERQYHERFADYQIRGEWFEPHAEILAEIERLAALQRER